MATDIGYIKEAIRGIEAQLKIMDGNFVKKDDLSDMKLESEAIHKDHEIRIRRLETWGFMALGALALFELITKFIDFGKVNLGQ